MATAIRNLLIRLTAPFASLLFGERPLRRVIALHDIPTRHEALFVEKMEWLKTHANVVPLAALARGEGLAQDRLNIALTFDDGFKEYAGFVAKTLSRMGLPATFFVPSGALGLVGDDARRFSKEGLKRSITFEFMTEDEVRSLSIDPLFTIGGHTTHHRDVATLDERGREEEIADDKSALERIIGKRIEWFAYPFGGVANINAAAMRVIGTSGYQRAFSILPSFWKRSDHRFLIGRDSMSVADTIPLWDAWLKGGYDAYTAVKNAKGKSALLAGEPE